MARHKVHFGNENKARDFANERGGKLSENKGNTEKPYTVSFTKEQMDGYTPGDHSQRNENFGSDINGKGTNWHTSEDL